MNTIAVRMHTYRVGPDELTEFLSRRAALVAGLRAEYPGLAQVQLIRLEDGTYRDTWRWDSFEQMAAAFPAAGSPQAAAVQSFLTEAAALNGEIVDER
ncbi:hypothetical protein EV138_7490 [Kribbella voronezhensis]|uniref:Antibiotic biosynthesis monooxygenase n=1 Tax=Kribbella voronezhensis TaxID=2512212 RepID=A0A4R7SUQ0_9ACTN|nr:hypothetical protein [Kribbella voronezhensis]TDU82595.1 hypothetical protein EV138_7490 [Kribbella voronezhensis]